MYKTEQRKRKDFLLIGWGGVTRAQGIGEFLDDGLRGIFPALFARKERVYRLAVAVEEVGGGRGGSVHL